MTKIKKIKSPLPESAREALRMAKACAGNATEGVASVESRAEQMIATCTPPPAFMVDGAATNETRDMAGAVDAAVQAHSATAGEAAGAEGQARDANKSMSNMVDCRMGKTGLTEDAMWRSPSAEMGAEMAQTEKTGRNSPFFSALSCTDDVLSSSDEFTPVLDEKTFCELPNTFKRLPRLYGHQERETETMLVLGQIATVSAVLPTVYAVDDGKNYFPNISLMVAAPPASGKGALANCWLLVKNIDKLIRDKYAETTKVDGQKTMKVLRFPGNSSNASFVDLLKANDGRGLVFETEAKAIINMLQNTEYGLNAGTVLLICEHETIMLARKKNNEYIRIDQPMLSFMLSGVESDVLDLFGRDGMGSGLVSRMLFYFLRHQKRVYRIVYDDEEDQPSAEEQLRDEMETIYKLYTALQERDGRGLKMIFTKRQMSEFTQWIAPIYEDGSLTRDLGEDFDSTILRFRVHVKRIAMVLQLVGMAERGDLATLKAADKLEVEDRVFGTAMEIGGLLFAHAQYLFAVNTDLQLKMLRKKERGHKEQLVSQIKMNKWDRLCWFLLNEHDNVFTRKDFNKAAKRAAYSDIDSLWRRNLNFGKIKQMTPDYYSIADPVGNI